MNASRARHYRILIYMALAFVPIMVFRDYTQGNELRYLSIADEALRNGTWFSFTNHGEVYADKPPLYFWILMCVKSVFGQYHAWILALFSLIPALVVTFIMDKWVAEEVDDRYRMLGQMMLMSCGLFAGMAFFLRMDMLLTMFIVLSLRVFYNMLYGKGNMRLNGVLFPIYIFLGIFTKGPSGLLITLAATITFLIITHRKNFIKRCWGWRTWGILATATALWLAAVYNEAGGGYLYNLVFHQTLGRAFNSFHHAQPFYYYLECIWYVLAPWSLLAVGIIAVSVKRHLINTELQRFFFIIVCATFIVQSLISAKLAVYILPIIPFTIYLMVMLLPKFKWNKWAALAMSVPLAAFTIALPALIIMVKATNLAYLNHPAVYITSTVLTATGIVSLVSLYHRRHFFKPIIITSCGVLCAIFAAGCAMPNLNGDLGYGALCMNINGHVAKAPANGYYAWRLYRAENMDVYLHDSIHVIKAVKPGKCIANHHGALLITKDCDTNKLPASIKCNKVCHEGSYTVLRIP